MHVHVCVCEGREPGSLKSFKLLTCKRTAEERKRSDSEVTAEHLPTSSLRFLLAWQTTERKSSIPPSSRPLLPGFQVYFGSEQMASAGFVLFCNTNVLLR